MHACTPTLLYTSLILKCPLCWPVHISLYRFIPYYARTCARTCMHAHPLHPRPSLDSKAGNQRVRLKLLYCLQVRPAQGRRRCAALCLTNCVYASPTASAVGSLWRSTVTVFSPSGSQRFEHMCFLQWVLGFSEISTSIFSSLFFLGGWGGRGGVSSEICLLGSDL